MMNLKSKNFAALLTMAASCAAWAGPVSTVAWNGHDGAVSFTFDDGYNQLDQLGSYLNSNPDVKVTFFITGAMGAGSGDMSGYVSYAKNHKDMKTVSDLTGETSGWKSSLLSKGAPEVYTFATPYCSSNDNVANAISKDHIANRNCAGAKYYGWGTEPDWMDISSNCYTQGGNSTNNAKSNMATAKNQKSWTVQLNHGVGTASSDTYGVPAADIKAIMDEAQKQGLWVAPFGVVAAYYRAHFAMDKAEATTTSEGFKVSWASPHSAMPKSVPLRVNIQNVAGRTVSQKGKVVAPNADGTYTIEFMALELDVTGEPPEVKPFKGAIEIPGTIEGENYDTYAFEHAQSESDATGYRTDDAGIVKAGEGFALGYTSAGDYFEYTLDVKAAGSYKVFVNGATGNSADGSVTVSVGTQKVDVAVVAQGDWDTYSESAGGEIQLQAGKQTLRLTVNDNNLNVDWIKIAAIDEAPISSSSEGPAENSSSSSVTEALAGSIQMNRGPVLTHCEIFDLNGNRIKGVDATAGTPGELWNQVKVNLGEGVYIMRFGSGKSMQTLSVRK